METAVRLDGGVPVYGTSESIKCGTKKEKNTKDCRVEPIVECQYTVETLDPYEREGEVEGV